MMMMMIGLKAAKFVHAEKSDVGLDIYQIQRFRSDAPGAIEL
jgi:hypothetical protein